MGLDLRKLRYFVAVAEELNFGRAAERLRIAQPALSRQIRALEQDLKVELFDRSSRGTELTDAGRRLLDDARPLLASADAVERRVRSGGRFTVAFMPGILVTAAVREFAAEFPDLAVEVLRTSYQEQAAVLLDGRADVSFVRMPVPAAGLTIVPLFTEARVVAVPVEHRLAGKDRVHVADLADERLLQDPDLVPEWRDIAGASRAGWRSGPLSTMEEKLEHVAAGQGFIVVPRSAAALYTRADVGYAELDGVADNQVALAYNAQRGGAELDRFVEIAVRQFSAA
ncbi:DNA-binding transcriptional regulator, LysR family [Asanoa hainanensis]|uniref:DNA-binding transcriptional regulator, LysR family n=1 Tax=Asanoa hainanensis TaxID=560556 RepID=A0A239MS02_9ACTN|nr:LysR substrate-binding domain-containing protein [Asanoa hainanensis]SNT44629.1 DNA-binding transcriptional regulator, LysR family [Asanoa hainanensis]